MFGVRRREKMASSIVARRSIIPDRRSVKRMNRTIKRETVRPTQDPSTEIRKSKETPSASA
jgi:hypothetical protein